MGAATRSVLIAVAAEPSRRRLRDLLGRRPDVVCRGECGSAVEAVRAIREGAPDIVLLEVQLPDLDGFEVVRRVGAEAMPVVVFITSLDRRVLGVLEVHALDYLLEPFDDERFHAAVDRAARLAGQFARQGLARRLARLLAADEEGSRQRRVPVHSAGKIQFVPLDEVRWVEGAGSFARLHLYDGRTHLLRETLGELGERFADDFFRIHRSILVRSSEVSDIERSDDGVAVVRLRDGSELRVGRDYRDNLEPLRRSPGGGRAGRH